MGPIETEAYFLAHSPPVTTISELFLKIYSKNIIMTRYFSDMNIQSTK